MSTTQTAKTTAADTITTAAAAAPTTASSSSIMPILHVNSPSLLPHKKRKASNASSSIGSSQSGGAATHETSGSGGRSSSGHSNNKKNSSSVIPAKLREERRLPRKKRKETHVEEQQQQQQQQQQSIHSSSLALPVSPTRTQSVPSLPNILPNSESGRRSRKGSFLDFLDESAPAINDGPTAMAASEPQEGSEKKQTHDSLLGTVPGTDCVSELSNNRNDNKPDEKVHKNGTTLEESADTTHDTAKTEQEKSSALDHLDALQSTKEEVSQRKDSHENCNQKPAAAPNDKNNKHKPRSNSGSSTAEESFASSGHRLLMEAIMMKDSTGGNNSATTMNLSTASERTGVKLEHLPYPAPLHALRDRLDSFPPPLPQQHASGRDRLDSIGYARDRLDSFVGRDRLDSIGFGGRDRLDSLALPPRDRLDSFALQRDRLDSFAGAARERLESWGGMSDLSMPVVDASVMATAMAAATHLQQGNFLLDDSHNNPDVSAAPAAERRATAAATSAVPSRISLQRDRLNSIASLSEFSASGALVVDGIDLSGGDLQAFVAAAMASVGDQISELAGAMEHVVAAAATGSLASLEDDEGSSAASAGHPMIGVAAAAAHNDRRPRSWSACSSLGKISVDLDAVQAAVVAAEAASGSLGLAASASSVDDQIKMAPPPAHKVVSSLSVQAKAASGRSRVARRSLPLNKRARTSSDDDDHDHDDGDNDTTSNKRSTRKAKATSKAKSIPLKKRGKRNSPPQPSKVKSCSTSTMPTPKTSNRSIAASAGLHDIVPPVVTSSSCDVVTAPKRPPARSSVALEKWESMFSALIEFREERRALESTSEEQQRAWVWDGNVPTNYKTKDGKPLGRWINNQRSAYTKGMLKEDRQQRLLEAGLKWSVAKTKNPWDCMLKELSIYISEQTAHGSQWDGNVPTHYVIKKRPDDNCGEDKNLGRWINRQRSMYHSGRLRKDRQLALENVGLKWSMQFTTSWEEMFETLREYVEEQKAKNGGAWDGNVPTLYRTQHNPSRSLGRWVNRQRSRRTKKKLKQEYIDKLTAIGMVWSMHKQSGGVDNEADDDDDGDDFVEYHKTDAGDKVNGNDKNGTDKNGKENATKVSTVSDKPSELPQPPITSSSSGPMDLPNELNMEKVVIGETAMI